MILKENFAKQYLEDSHKGLIKLGLGIEIPSFDTHFRYKKGEFTIVNGVDNVGKTDVILWYFTVLALKHGLKFDVWSGENKAGQLVKRIIQWIEGKKINEIELSKICNHEQWVYEYFNFIDPNGFYTSEELFKLFSQTKSDCCLIDPYTGMNRKINHESNYQFLNDSRHFVNNTGKSLFVNTHVLSEAARRTYYAGHELEGYIMPPKKSDSEGGQPFANRPDNFITLHRLVGHPQQQFYTWWFTRKVKDTETGGLPNAIDDPVKLHYNYGLGFVVDGINTINNFVKPDEFSKLENNQDFEKESSYLDKFNLKDDVPF